MPKSLNLEKFSKYPVLGSLVSFLSTSKIPLSQVLAGILRIRFHLIRDHSRTGAADHQIAYSEQISCAEQTLEFFGKRLVHNSDSTDSGTYLNHLSLLAPTDQTIVQSHVATIQPAYSSLYYSSHTVSYVSLTYIRPLSVHHVTRLDTRIFPQNPPMKKKIILYNN